MLERSTLLVRAWELRPGPPQRTRSGRFWARAICDEGGTQLGAAWWRPDGAPAWWRAWGVPWLAVHEADDEPLLFSAHRVWGLGPRWDVCDADRFVVGSLRRKEVFDVYGRLLARARGVSPRFRSPEGLELAQLASARGEARLTFGPHAAGDPFTRMLLLAAALVWT